MESRKLRFQRFLVSPCPISLVWVPWAFGLTGFVLSMLRERFLEGTSILTLLQAEQGLIGDWHPPIFTGTWKLLLALTGSPCGACNLLYVLQFSGLFVALFFLMLPRHPFWKNTDRYRKSWFAVLLLAVLLLCLGYCVLRHFTPEIAKDHLLSTSYLLGIAGLMNWPEKTLRRWLVGGLILCFFFYGTALRHNAVFTVLPLLMLFVWRTCPGKKFPSILFHAALLWGIMLGTIHYLHYGLLGAVRLYPLQERFYNDFFQLNCRTSTYVNPPDSFDNRLADLDEEVFRNLYVRNMLFTDFAFQKVAQQYPDRDFSFFQEFILILPTEEYARLSDKKTTIRQCRIEGNDQWKRFSREWKISESKPLRYKDVAEIRQSWHHDFALLRKAWIERIAMEPIEYPIMKTNIFLRFCRKGGFALFGIDATFFMIVLCMIVPVVFLSPNRLNDALFPAGTLALAGLFYLFPYWMFLVDFGWRYLLWFYCVALLAMASFVFHSEFLRSLVVSVVRHCEEKMIGDVKP